MENDNTINTSNYHK